MKNNLTPKETEYMEYLDTPRTTKELMRHFDAKKSTCWQLLRTLRLKRLVHRVPNGNESYWKVIKEGDDVPPTSITPLQAKYLEYLKTPRSTREIASSLEQNMSAVQQVTRTLRLMGYVEAVGGGSSSGHGGCWKLWKATDDGTKRIEEYVPRPPHTRVPPPKIDQRIPQKNSKSVCGTLKQHAKDLKDDPERLSTSFMQNLIEAKYDEKNTLVDKGGDLNDV